MHNKYWIVSDFVQQFVIAPIVLMFVGVIAVVSAYFISGGNYEPSNVVIYSGIALGAITSIWCLAWVFFLIADRVVMFARADMLLRLVNDNDVEMEERAVND